MDPDETAYNEPSRRDQRYFTFSLSALHMNFQTHGSFNKTDETFNLKFGSERINVFMCFLCFIISERRKEDRCLLEKYIE